MKAHIIFDTANNKLTTLDIDLPALPRKGDPMEIIVKGESFSFTVNHIEWYVKEGETHPPLIYLTEDE